MYLVVAWVRILLQEILKWLLVWKDSILKMLPLMKLLLSLQLYLLMKMVMKLLPLAIMRLLSVFIVMAMVLLTTRYSVCSVVDTRVPLLIIQM